jgi:hypothetical protein
MKRLSSFLLIFVLLISANAQTGSKSLLHVQQARTFKQGWLVAGTELSFFTKLGSFIGEAPTNVAAANWWAVTNNIVLTYGIFDNLDLTAAVRLYQDINRRPTPGYNLPDDIFLNLKAGSFAFGGRKFYGSGMFKLRIPTAETPNYLFREYTSNKVEYGFMAAFSYHIDPYLPDRSFSTHLNIGWYNHNDAGSVVYTAKNGTEQKARFNATELQYGLGFIYPVGEVEFMLEAHGINYIEQPDTMVFSRENWGYVTPSIRYRPYSWLRADFGVDISFSSKDITTSGVPDPRLTLDVPAYSDWRVHMGLSFTILPVGSTAQTAEEIERDRFNQRIDFFQSIIEDRERAEKVQEELDRLKREREEAEKELEELKQILEEEG